MMQINKQNLLEERDMLQKAILELRSQRRNKNR